MELLPASFNKTHIKRSRELNKGCRAMKTLKFLFDRQKFSKKKNQISIFMQIRPVQAEFSLHVSANLGLHQGKLCFALRFVKQITPMIGINIYCVYIAVSLRIIILDASMSVVCHFTSSLLCSYWLSCQHFNNIETN